MVRARTHLWLFIGLALVHVDNYAQQPETLNDAVFRVSSTLVQVDAVVTDSKGHQVPNLTASDFEIYADGKFQTIKQFAYVSVARQRTSAALSKDLAQAAPPASNIRREDVRRTIVLMIDDLNLSFESLAFVRDSLLKFIDQQAEPGDLIAVCRTGSGSGALQQFTSDRRVTRAIIGNLRWNPNGLRQISFLEAYDQYSDLRSPNERARRQDVKQDSPNPRGTDAPAVDPMSLPSGRISGQLENLRRNTMTAGALGAIDYVVQALRDMPGRKSVVLFSDGFNLDRGDERVMNAMRRLVDRANRSGTVIYTMHAAGLQVLLPTAGDNPNLSRLRSLSEVADAISAMTKNRSEELFNAQAGLDYLANVTGGFAYLNGNDFDFGLAQVLEDQRGYYVLAYSPPAGTFNEKNGERPYHKLNVILKDNPRLTIRSRSGFFGATDEETKPQHQDELEQLRATMFSPFSSSGIRLRLTPIYSEVAGHGSMVRNLLDVDTRDLTFKTMPDGSAQTALKLLVAAYGVDNRPIRSFGADYTFTVMPGKMKDAERDGVLYTLSMDLPKPGGVQIRAAVLDKATAKTGSAQEYLEIPDLRKKQISLTSVILANNQVDSDGAMPLDASAARRQFQRGSVLQYFCLVESGRGRNEPDDISAQLRIVRENKQILLLPVKVRRLADNQRAISGQLKLGSGLPPEDYFLQVIASVRGPGRAAVTDQWNDFEIVP